MLSLPAFAGTPELDRVYHADLFTLCAAMPDASVDCILCDLPYASLEVGWDRLIPAPAMWHEFKRLITPTGAIVLTTKQPFSAYLLTSNPAMYRYSWYWEKSKGANVAQTAYRPLAVIEEVMVFSHAPAVFSVVPTIKYYAQGEKLQKPYKRTFKAEHKAVSNHSSASPIRNPERMIGEHVYERATPRSLIHFPDDPDRGLHPTQKPVALFEYLIRTYTQPGELVFDPCVGSGTTALAAYNTDRRFICGDITLEYVEIARARLAKARATPRQLELLPVG